VLAGIQGQNVLLRGIVPVGGRLDFIPKLNVFDAATLVQLITAPGFEIIAHTTPGGANTQFIIARKP